MPAIDLAARLIDHLGHNKAQQVRYALMRLSQISADKK
jgi:hypothetical protein